MQDSPIAHITKRRHSTSIISRPQPNQVIYLTYLKKKKINFLFHPNCAHLPNFKTLLLYQMRTFELISFDYCERTADGWFYLMLLSLFQTSLSARHPLSTCPNPLRIRKRTHLLRDSRTLRSGSESAAIDCRRSDPGFYIDSNK